MTNSFKNIYKGKKILVTGHTGFKGSWLSLWLKELGAEVIGYALEPNTQPSLFKILELEKEINHITGDIRDENHLKKVFKENKPDIVFHLAAQPLVRRSYKEPKLTYETNIIGTVNLFEAVRETPSVQVVLNATSDKCYENKECDYSYKETDAMGGYDPYSSSKGATELVISAYRNSFLKNISVSSARAGNVIGGGDWSEDRLIPDCIRYLVKDEKIIIRNPEAVRPWQFVLEPISGYLWLGALSWLNPKKYSEGWNFGPENEGNLSVENIVKKILELWGHGKYEINLDYSLHEAKLLMLDINKAKSVLNWQPVYKVITAIENTIEWYKAYYDNNSMTEYSINALKRYSLKAKELNIEWSLR